MDNYYQIPLSFTKILKQEKLKRYDLDQSIKCFIHLLILTNFQEYRREDEFGCDIWESEFEILPLESRWQSQIKNSITTSIKNFEKRLEEIEVSIKTDQTTSSMKKIEINISGKIVQTAEPFEHIEIIFLCPKSIS